MLSFEACLTAPGAGHLTVIYCLLNPHAPSIWEEHKLTRGGCLEALGSIFPRASCSPARANQPDFQDSCFAKTSDHCSSRSGSSTPLVLEVFMFLCSEAKGKGASRNPEDVVNREGVTSVSPCILKIPMKGMVSPDPSGAKSWDPPKG